MVLPDYWIPYRLAWVAATAEVWREREGCQGVQAGGSGDWTFCQRT
jgi:hypothetical protein